MQLLEISTRPYREHSVLTLRGELDLAGMEELRTRLRGAAERDVHLVLDLTELTFIDSTGLSVLVEYHNKINMDGGTLTLVGPTPQVQKVLNITGLDQHLRIRERIEDAV